MTLWMISDLTFETRLEAAPHSHPSVQSFSLNMRMRYHQLGLETSEDEIPPPGARDQWGWECSPSLYWKSGKRPRNMSGWRWYKASTGFWRPGGNQKWKWSLKFPIFKTHRKTQCPVSSSSSVCMFLIFRSSGVLNLHRNSVPMVLHKRRLELTNCT